METGVATHSNVYLIASYICVKWNKITPYLLTQKLSSVTKVETLYAPEYTDAEQTSAVPVLVNRQVRTVVVRRPHNDIERVGLQGVSQAG